MHPSAMSMSNTLGPEGHLDIILYRKEMIELEAAKYEIQKPSTCRATVFRFKFSSMPVSRFSPCVVNLPAAKTFVAG